MLTPERFREITATYPKMTVAVIGDFCLDRYFDLDPSLEEVSIETGLAVHNITRVRCQPGGAGTIVNNLAALGVGRILPVGFTGIDGEGWELRRALQDREGVDLSHLLETPDRHTFTYTKPLVHEPGHPPRELNRLDIKNHSPTPRRLREQLADEIWAVCRSADTLIVLDQVDEPDTGVISRSTLKALKEGLRMRPGGQTWVLGDSRRGFEGWPSMALKMNASELSVVLGVPSLANDAIEEAALRLAKRRKQSIFVTQAGAGMLAAHKGEVIRQSAFPVQGPVDVVGAGDSVTANLSAALAAGAAPAEAMLLAMAAANLVVHQLGTTGTASVRQIESRMFTNRSIERILKLSDLKPPTRQSPAAPRPRSTRVR